MTLEAPILKLTMMEASALGSRLFRNNRGLFYTMDGRKVRAGLEAEGASDLIGITPVVITPDMVGRTIAVFTAIETKKSTWVKPMNERERTQANFLNFVKKMGGIGEFINNQKNLKKTIDEYKNLV